MSRLRNLIPSFWATCILLLLAACGSDSQTLQPTPSPVVEESVTQDLATPVLEPTEEPTTEPVAEEVESSEENSILVIESWRSDDAAVWQEIIIPAFNQQYPNIEVVFAPSPPVEYDEALAKRLENGVAGDLITCRPFDRSLALFDQGHLLSVNDLEGIENFDSVAKSAWVTDNGSDVFCVPMASVLHGFVYNQDIFDQVGVAVPTTVDEFFAAMDTFKEAGITPLAIGTADQWDIATMGFQSIGPNYWRGENGRVSLITGSGKFTDPEYVATFEQLARWSEYMPENFKEVTYPEARDIFIKGEAAIYPAGSWDISFINEQADFAVGAFNPPVRQAGNTCYISDHTDIGIGINADTKYPEAAKTFLNWVASNQFADLFSNATPGFYSLSKSEVQIDNPLAAEFLSWREQCRSTIRNSYQILSRGEPSLEDELWRVSTAVVNGDLTPEQGAQELQDGLESWYFK